MEAGVNSEMAYYVLSQPERYTLPIDQSDRRIGISDILSSLAIPLQF